jgi:hypothetical protein
MKFDLGDATLAAMKRNIDHAANTKLRQSTQTEAIQLETGTRSKKSEELHGTYVRQDA